MRSQLLIKRADVINECLADPRSGEERPASPDAYDNPFASKTREENRVASISQHETSKFLPNRPENQSHLDDDVKKEIQMEKEAAGEPTPQEWIQKAQALNSAEVRLMKLVQKSPGRNPMELLSYFGGNSAQLMRALNNLASKGYIGVKNNAPVNTPTTDRLIKTYDDMKSGAVVASWKASLLSYR